MQESLVTNDYLKNCIVELQESLSNEGEYSQEKLINMINELMVSTLLIPGITEDDELVFEVLTSEDETINAVPLFCDDAEFVNYYGDEAEFNPIANDIDFYVDLIKENGLDGVIINPASDEFFIEHNLLIELPLNLDFEIDENIEGYDVHELLNIALKTTNDSLTEFIRSEDNQFEKLMLELSSSTLFNVVASENDLSKYAQAGIISIEDVQDFSLCTTGDENTQFGVLFSDIETAKQSLEENGLNYYYQIVLLDDFIEFILNSDMDGILINPGSDDYLIPRKYLIEAYNGLIYNNPLFKNAADYLFEF